MFCFVDMFYPVFSRVFPRFFPGFASFPWFFPKRPRRPFNGRSSSSIRWRPGAAARCRCQCVLRSWERSKVKGINGYLDGELFFVFLFFEVFCLFLFIFKIHFKIVFLRIFWQGEGFVIRSLALTGEFKTKAWDAALSRSCRDNRVLPDSLMGSKDDLLFWLSFLGLVCFLVLQTHKTS